MLRKIVVALAAGALVASFSLAPTGEVFAAKAKKAKVKAKAKVAVVAPAPNPLACVVGVVFLPIKILAKQPVC
jgi:hypothetical protein